MTTANDQSNRPASRGGPLDMPGGNNGRPGEDRDGPPAALKEATDLDFDGAARNDSATSDAGSPGGTAGTTDVARVQEDRDGR